MIRKSSKNKAILEEKYLAYKSILIKRIKFSFMLIYNQSYMKKHVTNISNGAHILKKKFYISMALNICTKYLINKFNILLLLDYKHFSIARHS